MSYTQDLAGTLKTLGLGFLGRVPAKRVLGSGFRVLGLGFRVLGLIGW